MSAQTEVTSSELGAAIAHVRTELSRADAKAGTLLALAGTALTVLLALLARTSLPGLAVTAGWLTAAVVATAVAHLALAIRPSLTGDHGLVRYARRGAAAVREELDAVDRGHWDAVCRQKDRDHETLIALSRSAVTKYRRIRTAVDLMLAGLAGITLTAALAALL
ncbi:Pycsar system effector family protein [Actinoplanes sp. TFC3]|uniref:Pycsar system effector family protein n=1 Tax=Actinoplanes sp. TFC3 TaxID=1710355 RepID=UPI000829DC9D|nr:Pycsar system effector family protein [Actinoplanes sp. TFC3]